MFVRFSEEPIDPKEIYALMEKNGSGFVGSVVLHFAVVKKDGGKDAPTVAISYAANGDVIAELEAIAAGLIRNRPISDLVLFRRRGRVPAGAIISLIAASSPNSQDAFAVCQEGLEKLKKMKTIRKEELPA